MNTLQQHAPTDGDRPTVHVDHLDNGAIAVVTLFDPRHANAMSPEMGDAFARAIRQLQDERELRAVIVRGEGKDFSIGGHREMLIGLGTRNADEAQLREFMLAFYDRWLPLLDLAVPVISALRGQCIGVAPVFACAPDIVIADESLSLQVTFAALGLYPGMALPELLRRKIGPHRAALLMTAGEAVSGREAERLGLVERCVRVGELDDETVRVARGIVAAAPETVRLLTKNLRVSRRDLLSELQANATQQARDFRTDEYRKRVANYLPNHYDAAK